MKVITYLGFTVLSIFIQFCVMDFIQDKLQISENAADVNISNIEHHKKVVDDILKNISSKPHALYYKTHIMHKSLKRSPASSASITERAHNSSIPAIPLGTTDISTTIFDILYDENTSATETTTDIFFTTTELDNVTEITLFETKNKSSTVPNIVPKINFSKHCDCNLLFKVCDVNCCCDQDCTHVEQKHFRCEEKTNVNRLYNDGCLFHLLDGSLGYGSNVLDSLFCVVKTNLPEKHNIKQPNLALVAQSYKWKNVMKKQTLIEFKKRLYSQTDPIWLLKNGTIYYLDFPTPMINNYCTDRAPIVFLKEEKIQCIVKFEDLEMFHVSRTSEDSMVVSATESTFNGSALNCSNLYCVNWTVLACDYDICMDYNRSLNEASCTESVCTNVALRIDYLFYYYESKIINATIKLYMQNISNLLPFMLQEINIKFVMTNKSRDSVIEFSGNPGYISHLPIIISDAKNNYTENFFNNTSMKNRMVFPENRNGMCILSNSSHNIVRFGVNKRMKCRYVHEHGIVTQNNTSVCKNIQDIINNLLGLNKEIKVSPFGNPYDINDDNWIKMQTELNNEEPVYGEYRENVSKLSCYNIINRVSVIFVFANVDEKDITDQNKILLAKYEAVVSNVSFNIEDISTVLTIDVIFVDATKPNLYVYAGSPHINIHLPKDFFFPFPSNKSLQVSSNLRNIITLCCVAIFFANKITLE